MICQRQTVCLALVFVYWGCSSRSVFVNGSDSASPRYPVLFQNPIGQGYGIGFARRFPNSIEESYRLANEQALRLFAWSIHVRVKGVRQFELTAAGYLEFRGQQVDLLELHTIEADQYRLDTLTTSEHVWIIAAPQESIQIGASVPFPKEPPPWIAHSPPDEAMTYAFGIEQIPQHDEAGRWEVATYDALVGLAFKVSSRFKSIDKVYDQVLTGAQVMETDTVLRGFRVVARWRDDRHLYVLAGVPRGGATSNLD